MERVALNQCQETRIQGETRGSIAGSWHQCDVEVAVSISLPFCTLAGIFTLTFVSVSVSVSASCHCHRVAGKCQWLVRPWPVFHQLARAAAKIFLITGWRINNYEIWARPILKSCHSTIHVLGQPQIQSQSQSQRLWPLRYCIGHWPSAHCKFFKNINIIRIRIRVRLQFQKPVESLQRYCKTHVCVCFNPLSTRVCFGNKQILSSKCFHIL